MSRLHKGSRLEPSRRDFLQAGGLGALSLGLSGSSALGSALASGRQGGVILLNLVGGPSQLETFDPKPDAPENVRGPFESIQTSVPGIRINEFLPKIAQRMDRLTLIRTLHHDEAPIHETGLQLIQTGRISRGDEEFPHFGAEAAKQLGPRGSSPPFVILSGPIGRTGVAISKGQTEGRLGAKFRPISSPGVEDDDSRFIENYGRSEFGRNCRKALRLIENGTRVVVVNRSRSVFYETSWDVHGASPFSTFDDYSRRLLPSLDSAFSGLVDDLRDRGLLATTLVVATGEFGRTPRINDRGGRDHWPHCWSALLAGGSAQPGTCIGTSDRHAAEPVDHPFPASELWALMCRTLGIDLGSEAGLS